MKNRIREIRKKQEMSQKEFGNALGLKANSISYIESGKNAITEQNIKMICSIFNVNEEWLRTGKGEMKKQNPELDETAVLISDLLEDINNPTRAIIGRILKTYSELDEKSQRVIDMFSKKLLESGKDKESK